MNQYDVVFIGQLGISTIVPFEGRPYIDRNSPVVYAAIAASCLGKRVAAVTKISGGKGYLLEPLETAGIDIFVRPGQTMEGRVAFPTTNIDQKQVCSLRPGDPFAIGDIPALKASAIHLCCWGTPKGQLDLVRALKTRGFCLSFDMQGFMLQSDMAGFIHLVDAPEKKEIVRTVDFVKLDAAEGQILTGVDTLEEQAEILENWGGSEIIVTSSAGALVRHKGKSTFARFTNRSTRATMGRGDTFIGAYLSSRLAP